MATATKQAETYDGSTPLPNAKHEQFCHEYPTDFNLTQAYIRAGYSKNGARQSANKLLTNADIRARLAYLRAERTKQATKTADDIERELEKLAFSDVTNVVTWNESGMCFVKSSDEIDPEHSAAIESIQVEEKAIGKEGDGGMVLKTKVKQHSKLKALELLGKHKGMFVEKVEHSLDKELENRLTSALKRDLKEKDE
jgi:phage terminase small subunit